MAEEEKEKKKKILDWKTFRRLASFIKPHKSWFIFLLLLTVLMALLGPVRPLLIERTVNNEIIQGDYAGLLTMTIILISLLFFDAIIQYTHAFLSGWLGQTIIKDIRLQLYRYVLGLKLRFYDKTPIGKLVTRNVSDIETLSNVFSQGIAALLGDILLIITILVVMFTSHWKLTLISLSLLPLLLLSTYVFKEKIKKAFDETRTAVSSLNAFVQEHVTGMNIVQIFGSEENEFKKFKEINRSHRKAHLKAVLYYSIYFPVAEIISAGGIGLLVWFGARGVLHEEIALGTLIAFIMYISLFFRPIRMIADRFNTLQMGIVSMHRIAELLDSEEKISNEGNYKPKELKGNIRFENVWFAYDEENFVLKNISFEVKEGETVALVGATGAGKSSIINLISRFYEIQEGQIFVDNKEIKDYDLEILRTKIGVVLQDVFLFSTSIRENITLGNTNISEEKLRQASELVGALKFIEKLKDGFDYNVMERGSTLSVGQRQLISFVRAMVYDPKVIILDEATSSVDTETEEMIQNAIAKLMTGRTAIVIAHRLSTIQNADKIIVLDKGEIKEVGTHEELLAKEGYYARLHQMQYKEVV